MSKKILIVGILIIFFIGSFKDGQVIFLEKYFKEYNTSNINAKILDDKYIKLEIPSISLYQKVYDIGNIKNNIDLNVELLYKNNMLILVSHSGSADNAYFRNLKYLIIGDLVYINYDNKKEVYKVDKIYNLNKKENFGIKKSFQEKLVLITCLNKKEYLIVECQRQNT